MLEAEDVDGGLADVDDAHGEFFFGGVCVCVCVGVGVCVGMSMTRRG